eukprot:1157787-Pelagomonas_calceolata.AAC.9
MAGIDFLVRLPNSNPCYEGCCCWTAAATGGELCSGVELHKRGSHTGREYAPTLECALKT